MTDDVSMSVSQPVFLKRNVIENVAETASNNAAITNQISKQRPKIVRIVIAKAFGAWKAK